MWAGPVLSRTRCGRPSTPRLSPRDDRRPSRTPYTEILFYPFTEYYPPRRRRGRSLSPWRATVVWGGVKEMHRFLTPRVRSPPSGPVSRSSRPGSLEGPTSSVPNLLHSSSSRHSQGPSGKGLVAGTQPRPLTPVVLPGPLTPTTLTGPPPVLHPVPTSTHKTRPETSGDRKLRPVRPSFGCPRSQGGRPWVEGNGV